MKRLLYYLSVINVFILIGCTSNKTGVEITSFDPITNPEFKSNDSMVNIEADLSDAALNGIVIPTLKQCKGGKFSFNFTLNKNSEDQTRYFYKIFYQNESYKFPEGNIYDDENFYGSWENDSIGFKIVPEFDDEITITDSIVILGNPRNERKYFGIAPSEMFPDENVIEEKKNVIRADKKWYESVINKSKTNKIGVEEQLRLDAIWAITDPNNTSALVNNRLWRNPRMGKYEFMVVVISEFTLMSLPEYAMHIEEKNDAGKFINPFTFFQKGDSILLASIVTMKSSKKLFTKAKFDLGRGIYVDQKEAGGENVNKSYYKGNCGDSKKHYRFAHFQQYFHYINKDFPLKNISLVKDVMNDNFSRAEYNKVKDETKTFVETYVNSSDCPCKTVVSDSVQKIISIINPGNNSQGQLKKEHVGVKGRIGFSYGKWRAKIKFPPLINRDNVWVGLTNAFWLLAQETDAPWNARRESTGKVGYIPKSAPDNESSINLAKKVLSYSEIDFEILKESQFWPATSYTSGEAVKTEDAAASRDITVTCTNWDMACQDPIKFGVGAQKHIIDSLQFTFHRWNYWYKALTSKNPINHDEMFGRDYYYFEIEWLPTKIIWRIGPEKNKMKTVSIMDNTISAIPNNQMIPVVTQEWHNQEWWPMAPYRQNFIPFPKNDIVGKILEIEVE